MAAHRSRRRSVRAMDASVGAARDISRDRVAGRAASVSCPSAPRRARAADLEIPWACGAAGSRFARLGLRPKPPKGILRGGGYDGRYNTGPITTRMRKPMKMCFGVVLGLPLGCRFWPYLNKKSSSEKSSSLKSKHVL